MKFWGILGYPGYPSSVLTGEEKKSSENLLWLFWFLSIQGVLLCFSIAAETPTKGGFSWDLESGHEFKLFPANIWIFKLVFLMVFAIKMLLDYTYWLLNLLEFKCNHFNSLSLAELKFKNSNVGGKQLEFMSWLQISGKTAFSIDRFHNHHTDFFFLQRSFCL